MITIDNLCSAMLAIFSMLLVLRSLFCLFVPTHQSVLLLPARLLPVLPLFTHLIACSAGTPYFHEQKQIHPAPSLRFQHCEQKQIHSNVKPSNLKTFNKGIQPSPRMASCFQLTVRNSLIWPCNRSLLRCLPWPRVGSSSTWRQVCSKPDQIS
jgi:hypothetical protein